MVMHMDKKHLMMNSLIDEIVESVPFFKPYKGAISSFQDPLDRLMALPVTDKTTMREYKQSFFSNQLGDPLLNEKGELLSSKIPLVPEATTGSSGVPVICYKSNQERFVLALSAWKQRKLIAPEANQTTMFCLMHAPASQKRIVDDLRNLHDSNVEKVLQYLRDELKPLIIHGSPSDLYAYANYIRKSGFDLKEWQLSFIESNSELLTDEQRTRISDSFRTRVINNYGCREVWNIAYECSERKLHVSEEVHVETVDMQSGEPMAMDAEKYGEVLVTALSLKLYPIIRYRLGDIGRLSSAPCGCGQHSPVLELFEARKINLIHKLHHHDKLVNGLSLFKNVMQDLILAGHWNVAKYKVIQSHMDKFDVYFILTTNDSKQLKVDFERLATKRLGKQAKFTFQVTDAQDPIFAGKNYSFLSRIQ